MRKLRPRENIYGEGNGNPLQYSCLENPVDSGTWWAAVRGVAQSRTWLKQLSMHALEKEMATHSSVLAWRIPGTVEPGGLPSMGSHRVGHDWCDLAAAAEAEKIYNSSMDPSAEIYALYCILEKLVKRGVVKWSESCSVVSNSLWSHGLYSLWNSPVQNNWSK